MYKLFVIPVLQWWLCCVESRCGEGGGKGVEETTKRRGEKKEDSDDDLYMYFPRADRACIEAKGDTPLALRVPGNKFMKNIEF